MIEPNRLGAILIAAGIALAAASLGANVLGLDAYPTFGEFQYAGVSIGAITFMLGYAIFIATWRR
jgi:hypothetical protein